MAPIQDGVLETLVLAPKKSLTLASRILTVIFVDKREKNSLLPYLLPFLESPVLLLLKFLG